MQVIIQRDVEDASRLAARIVAGCIEDTSGCVLGLATGSTPRRLYARLIAMYRAEELDFGRVTTFNPDEFVGVPPSHPASCQAAMQRVLFDHVNLGSGHRHVADGMAIDLGRMISRYERAIELAGGIDLQILGVGADGHLAFNEPGSSLASRMRVVPVTLSKRRYLAAAFGDEAMIPRRAVTLGIGNILDSKRCLMLAFGEGKAEIVARIVEGPVTALVPASALQHHPDVTIIVDEAAASCLELVDYYREAEERRGRGY